MVILNIEYPNRIIRPIFRQDDRSDSGPLSHPLNSLSTEFSVLNSTRLRRRARMDSRTGKPRRQQIDKDYSNKNIVRVRETLKKERPAAPINAKVVSEQSK
jgi:hypothetical protein